jgi:hypothetical protein
MQALGLDSFSTENLFLMTSSWREEAAMSYSTTVLSLETEKR